MSTNETDPRAMGEHDRQDRPDRLASVPWRAVILYVLVACGLAWLVALPIWLSGGPSSPQLTVLVPIVGAVMMFTPTIAALIAMFVFKAPRSERARFLGLWPLRPARRVVWFVVGAMFAPLLIVILVIALAASFGFVQLDLVHFSGFQAMIDSQLSSLGAANAAAARAALPPIGLLVALQMLSIPFGAIVNLLFTLGEELGWRGWLLPALRPLGVWPALLITGVVWGLWHSPLILVGYNFGYTDWRGVALMVVGCVAWGALLGWARLCTGSVWPAALGHGALNSAGGLVLLLTAAGAKPDMGVVGPLGMIAWAVIAVIVVILVLTGQFSREPELAPRRVRSTQAPLTAAMDSGRTPGVERNPAEPTDPAA